MTTGIRIVASGVLLGSVAGCNVIPTVCTDELRSTIAVQVRDSITGQAAAQGATVIVRNATVNDSVVATSDSLLAYMGFENHVPAGGYAITVRKPGYLAWGQTAVVPKDGCHSGPGPQIVARIQRSP